MRETYTKTVQNHIGIGSSIKNLEEIIKRAKAYGATHITIKPVENGNSGYCFEYLATKEVTLEEIKLGAEEVLATYLKNAGFLEDNIGVVITVFEK